MSHFAVIIPLYLALAPVNSAAKAIVKQQQIMSNSYTPWPSPWQQITTPPPMPSSYGSCLTEGCVSVAAFILQNLDQDTNPCRDFYRYACGRFLDNTWVPSEPQPLSGTARKNLLLTPITTAKQGSMTGSPNNDVVRVFDVYDQRIENDVDLVLMPNVGPASVMRGADRKTSQFYRACVNAPTVIDKTASYAFIRQVFNDVGGFYILTTSDRRRPSNWSIEETMVRATPYMKSLGLMNIQATRDDYNASRFSLIIQPPSSSPTMVASLHSKNQQNLAVEQKQTLPSGNKPGAYGRFVRSLANILLQIECGVTIKTTTMAPYYYNNNYYYYTPYYPPGVIVPPAVDEAALASLIDFEKQLNMLIVQSGQNASSPSIPSMMSPQSSAPTRLDARSLYALCPSMDWLRITNRLGYMYNVSVLKISDAQRLDSSLAAFFDKLSIYATSTKYIQGLCQLLRQTMQKSDGPTTIQNFLSLAAVMPYLSEMEDTFRKPFMDYAIELESGKSVAMMADTENVLVEEVEEESTVPPMIVLPRLKQSPHYHRQIANNDNDGSRKVSADATTSHCRAIAKDFFGLVISRRYVERRFSQQAKQVSQQMAEDIRQELVNLFGDYSGDTAWMDAATRQKARMKSQSILLEMGYPERLLQPNWLEGLMYDLEITDKNHLQNMAAMSRFSVKYQIGRLDQVPDRKEWQMPPFQNNAEYDFSENAMHVPAAGANEPFFKLDYPLAWNYGATGYTIGHELTHSIDTSGAMYDANGQVAGNWWGDMTKREFQRRTDCLVNQIGNLTLLMLGSRIDGTTLSSASPAAAERYAANARQTLDENIADNGAVKLAYNAFRKRIGEGDLKRATLPGLTLTNEQVFFISIAQGYCIALSDSTLRMQFDVDVHSPNSIRVQAMMMNSQPWSAAFNCPNDGRSPMNPINKCQVW